MKYLKNLIIIYLISISVSGLARDYSELKQNFTNPPDDAKPRTWWHWTQGNITKAGITKDLEWMKRVGISGFHLADVNYGNGQQIDKKIDFASPEWYDAVKHTAEEAERLGLEMTIFSSAGWSLTGGPWVKPEQAMKKLVWSETRISGPQKFAGKLEQPPSNNGLIQNLGRGSAENPDPTFYGDAAVLAFRTPDGGVEMATLHPKTSTNAGEIDASALMDGDLNSGISIPAVQNGPTWLQFEFDEPFTVRAFTIRGSRGVPIGRLQASNDGVVFKTLVELPGTQLYRQGWLRTFAVPECKARFYRVEMTGAPLNPDATMNQPDPTVPEKYELSEIVLHSQARVHRWEEKAGFRLLFEYDSVPTPDIPDELVIPAEGVIDLTSKMNTDGSLDWQVPDGNWTILRFGYSLTGAKNRPATAAGLGYEVDKLSREHTLSYLEHYFGPIKDKLGPLFGKALQYTMMDSWEAGSQNWTDNMTAEFEKRRGYDPTPFMPVLAGRVVGSAEKSDRFLWDFRRTLADMVAENHYGVVSEYLHERGIGTYGEASGVSLEILEDALLCKKFMDIPMGEFWVRDLHPSPMYFQDVRGATSAAHVYGKPVVAAEAFTGGGYESPFTLKRVSDYWMAQGINRLVFHTSAHQPLDTFPGNTMVGAHIHRNITWAELAKPMMTYMARNSYMLQQGKPVADLLYLLNEGAPSSMPIWGAGLLPSSPEGYDYDYINADALINRLSVDDEGKLVLPDGTSYRLLVLPQTDKMTLPVIKKIEQLVKDGAAILGPKPTTTPGLSGYPQSETELAALANAIWGDLDGISRNKHRYEKGRVIWGLPIASVMDQLKVAPDVEYSKPLDMELAWIHRKCDDVDIYYLFNKSDKAQDIHVRFRVDGKLPELWDSDTGESSPASYSIENGLTTVPLYFPPYGSMFVVFAEKTEQQSQILPEKKFTRHLALQGPWKITFPPKMGAPESILVDSLKSWTENNVDGIRYFSGTAVYHKSFQLSKDMIKAGRLFLDLGEVRDVACVTINEKKTDILWKIPYRVDITDFVVSGENEITIEVTNEWTNRILGDHKSDVDVNVLPGSDQIRFFRPPPLEVSGLLGPVTIDCIEN